MAQRVKGVQSTRREALLAAVLLPFVWGVECCESCKHPMTRCPSFFLCPQCGDSHGIANASLAGGFFHYASPANSRVEKQCAKLDGH